MPVISRCTFHVSPLSQSASRASFSFGLEPRREIDTWRTIALDHRSDFRARGIPSIGTWGSWSSKPCPSRTLLGGRPSLSALVRRQRFIVNYACFLVPLLHAHYFTSPPLSNLLLPRAPPSPPAPPSGNIFLDAPSFTSPLLITEAWVSFVSVPSLSLAHSGGKTPNPLFPPDPPFPRVMSAGSNSTLDSSCIGIVAEWFSPPQPSGWGWRAVVLWDWLVGVRSQLSHAYRCPPA